MRADDPLDERSFAYLLPLSPDEALLESATFDSAIQKKDETQLLRYLRSRYPGPLSSRWLPKIDARLIGRPRRVGKL